MASYQARIKLTRGEARENTTSAGQCNEDDKKATTPHSPAAHLENIMQFLIQAPNFVGIFTFPGRTFPDTVPSLIL